MSGSSSRVSIPNNLSKTIQNLKEIAKNHSEDEIYAMLRECNMDPNETAQKLLFQDPFHEVKKKRDKRKENNREPADAKWRPVSEGRMGRGGWGNHLSHYTSHDAGGVGNFGKENEINHSSKKGIGSSSSPTSVDIENKSAIPTSSSDPCKIQRPVSVQGSTPTNSSVNHTISVKENLGVVITNKTRKSATGDAKRSVFMRRVSTSSNYLSSCKLDTGPGTLASDPVLVPSVDECIPSTVDAIKREVGSRRITVDATTKKVVSPDVSGLELSSLNGQGSLDMYNSCMHEKVQGKSLGFDGNQVTDASQATHPLSHSSSAGSRPSSNYSNRSQQLNGLSKVGPVKEWKPKATNAKPATVMLKLQTTDVGPTAQEASPCSSPALSSVPSDEPTSKLQSKLKELQFSDSKHVIIPSHLQVPESERTGLSFGSFDANFGLGTNIVNGTDTGSEVGSAELSESSQAIMESTEEPTSGIQIASPSGQEAEITDCFPSPAKMPENNTLSTDHPKSPAERAENLTSREPGILSSVPTAQEYDQSASEAVPVPDSSQYSVHTAPAYSNFGLVPQMLGNKVTTFEGAEHQARDATHIPSFLVQQPFDPATGYYTSMYRPTSGDGDGHFSPFFASASATKYGGNIVILPSQTGQMQESGNSLTLPSTGPAPLITQAASAMQSVPLFRPPPGVHISHYPPSYLPYSQYFPPFYIPSPSLPPFLSNAAFPQQPPTGNVYPGVPGSASVKYPISQYKPVTNVGNSNHIGMVNGYGAYSPSPVTTACSAGSEDLATSQYKESNVYIADQQSEGSAWIPTPGREISAMHAPSFYNLPAQGQHMAFAGIYHHATPSVAANTVHPMLQQYQALNGAVEMAGPPSGGVYQQPQRTQINWVNNY